MDIGIENTKEISFRLGKFLANQYVVMTKMRNFHWHIKGHEFDELHAFFEKLYAVLAQDIDEVAERIRSLGEKSPATLKEFLALTDINETSICEDGQHMLKETLKDFEHLIRQLRKTMDFAIDQGDEGTADMLIGLMKNYEKKAWMIRSSIER